jgi:hypothetical protein
MRKLIAGAGMATLIVAGAGVAAAQTDQTPTTETPTTGAPTTEAPTAGTDETPTTGAPSAEAPADSDRGCAGPGVPGAGRGERPARFGLRAAVIEALGIPEEELRAELEAGSTLAEIAEERGADIADVIAGVVEEAEAWVAEHPDSRLAQRFDAQQMTERLTDMANRPLDLEGRPGPDVLRGEGRRGPGPSGDEGGR